MSEYGVVLESGAVRFTRLLPGPIERVWAYLTEGDKRATWFCGGEAELRVGGHIDLHFQHGRITTEAPPEKYRKMNDEGFLSGGTITRCDPPTALAFIWGEDEGPASEVEFELAAEGEKVRLVLTHRKIASKAEMTNVSGGWHLHLGLLEDRLTGTNPRGFWSGHARLEKEYAERYAGLPEWGAPSSAG